MSGHRCFTCGAALNSVGTFPCRCGMDEPLQATTHFICGETLGEDGMCSHERRYSPRSYPACMNTGACHAEYSEMHAIQEFAKGVAKSATSLAEAIGKLRR